MNGYYFWLGLRSLKRNPLLTALIVLIIGMGIAACITTLTILYKLSSDPIPHKSHLLYVPQFDVADLRNFKAGEEPDQQMTYIDANNLLRDAKGKRQTVLMGIAPVLDANRKDLPPFFETSFATTREFFDMFEVPFKHGSAWSVNDDASGNNVAVLGPNLAEKLFGNTNPVGQRFRSDGREYTVTGVMDHWRPVPKYYRLFGSSATGLTEELWIPFRNAINREYRNNGWTNCSGEGPAPGYQGFLQAECNWIQYWVEFASPADVPVYRDYLSAYVQAQKKLGRMPRPENVRFRNLNEWLQFADAVNRDVKFQSWLGFGFLIVCLINSVGLILAKFVARSGEIGVRAALGASRLELFKQFLIEAGVMGLAGAVMGIALSALGLWMMGQQSDGMKDIANLDWIMLLTAIGLSVLTALLAGLLPTWRASAIKPALQLKSQ